MSTYHPDSWKLVKITAAERTVFKVLASWYGGFTTGNSWKLSSGIESVQVQGDTITLPQSSGSTYVLHRGAEHISGMIASVFDSFQTDPVLAKLKIEYVTVDDVLAEFDK